MAKKQITLIVDDLTGEEAENARTVGFAIDGVSYEIDLSPENAEKLSEAFAPYVSAGRRVGGRTRTSRSATSSDTSRIREWAIAQGIEVPSRGRIPQPIVDQYQAAAR
ncbi:histone-like nucleoid-structuring protein Lsr2 [Mesorhizobium japonicum]|uniref:histone-like nucleoid-structuring protein Lsr2 n=1 Tax=Mesorhizobium japonicum TaxID=2066070 RepID=UPI003B5BCDD6